MELSRRELRSGGEPACPEAPITLCPGHNFSHNEGERGTQYGSWRHRKLLIPDHGNREDICLLTPCNPLQPFATLCNKQSWYAARFGPHGLKRLKTLALHGTHSPTPLQPRTLFQRC